MNNKGQARADVQQRLAALSDSEFKAASQTVCNRINSLLLQRHSGSLLLYRAARQWREIDLAWIEEDKKFLCDYVSVSRGAPFPTKHYDIIFVPLLGFNNQGYRLGRGGGWYDRFLATQPQALKVGIGLESGRIDFRVDPHDIPMDVIITESEIIAKDQSAR